MEHSGSKSDTNISDSYQFAPNENTSGTIYLSMILSINGN